MVSSSIRRHLVTVCQQVLVLAVVLAALTPAARVITMDVLPPSQTEAALRPVSAQVPTAVVDPTVEEYSLTAPAGARMAAGALHATARRTAGGGDEVTSEAIPVHGYGTIGVTWGQGQQVADDAIAVEARYRKQGAWSDWIAIDYHDDHGPDPDSAEARNARTGTDALLVGEVDDVQVRVAAKNGAPADLKLAVVDPGEDGVTQREAPELDTNDGIESQSADAEAGDGSLEMRAMVVAGRPTIFSRAQWGADESMRDKPSLHYGEVHAGFVHHTVSANSYTRRQVPGIIRGIYAYHTRSLGWSDIGYNYLVDRFGRIWEGRYGGITRPVVGAHTLGYNDDAFAMSAIGNFETTRPTEAMIDSYGRLFAWKLGLHGVGAKWRNQWVTSDSFKAINGHRDAGSTACPGQYLYNRLDDIRDKAASYQRGWSGRELESNLLGTAEPDLVVRRATDGKVLVLPIRKTRAGGFRIGDARDTGLTLPGARAILKAGDWDRDGFGDLIVHNGDGQLRLYRGKGDGTFQAPIVLAARFARVNLLSAVGDMTGDGYPDLMGQGRVGNYQIFPGAGIGGLKRAYPAYSRISARKVVSVGRWDSDGAPDVFSYADGSLLLRPGNGPGGLDGTRQVTLDMSKYSWPVGVSDVGLVGHADLVVRANADGGLWLIPGSRTGFGQPINLDRNASGYNYIG